MRRARHRPEPNQTGRRTDPSPARLAIQTAIRALANSPRRWGLLSLVLVLLLTSVAFGVVARVNALQNPQTSLRMLASRTADRADPAPLDDLGAINEDESLYVFVDASADEVAWIAFYLDLTSPDELAEPSNIETQAPFDLAGTREDGRATPFSLAGREDGAHRVTAIIGRRDGSQVLLTGRFHIGTISTSAPTSTPSTTPGPSPEPIPTPTAPPTTDATPEAPTLGQQAFGVHQDLHYGVQEGAIEAAQRLGATVSRSSLLWDKVEAEQGQLNWASVDQFINQLVDAELQPLLYFVGSPAWINRTSDRFVVPTSEEEFSSWIREYSAFAEAAAARYRGQGSTLGNRQRTQRAFLLAART